MGSQRRKAFGGLSVPYISYWNSPCCIVGFGSASQNLWGGLSVAKSFVGSLCRRWDPPYCIIGLCPASQIHWWVLRVAQFRYGFCVMVLVLSLRRKIFCGICRNFPVSQLHRVAAMPCRNYTVSQLHRVAAPPCRSAAVSQLHRVARGISAAVTGGGSGSPLPMGVGRGRHDR